MKKFLLIALSIFGIMLGISACDDLSKEPRAKQSSLTFEAKGGTKTVEMVIKRHPWVFRGLQIAKNPEHSPYYMGEIINPEDFTNEVLADGTQRIHYNWVTFIIAKDKKSVQVTVEPNDTGKDRQILFWTHGGKVDFTNFVVGQVK